MIEGPSVYLFEDMYSENGVYDAEKHLAHMIALLGSTSTGAFHA